ncbi:MAG: hypothetical protein GQ582_07270 [Methyloprofundus sp.]|nr:hypothetical protein [Methyloprofundus sp.]
MSEQSLQQSLILDVRKMFIIALICGVLSVCLPQYFKLPLLAVLLPLLCMIIYTWLGYVHSEETVFLEQFADSVYYLGFLLTLVALVVSLYFYQSDNLDAGVLTANFSLALITTIFGLSVRIFINNFQIDLNTIERQMMTEVEHAANEMIRKAKLISMQLDVSHEETQIAIKQSVDNAAIGMQQSLAMIDEYAAASAEALLKNTHSSHQAIIRAADSFAENLQNTQILEDIFVDKLDIPLDRLVERLDKTQQLLQGLNTGQSDIAQHTQSIISSLERSVAEVDILVQSISVFNDKLYANTKVNEDFVQVVQGVAALADNTKTISASLEKQVAQSALAMQNYSKMGTAMLSLPDDVQRLSDNIQQAAQQFNTTFHAIGNNTESGVRIGDDLQEIALALSKTRETVQQISDFGMYVTSTFKRLEAFNNMMEEHTQLMTSVGGVAQVDIDLAKLHQHEMAGILRESRQYLAKIQQDTLKANTTQKGQI